MAQIHISESNITIENKIFSGAHFAPSTPCDVEVGFVASNCRFIADKGVGKGTCYIARPWRDFGAVELINCYLGEHINPAGFDDWGKTHAHKTVRFLERSSYGEGANGERPSYVKTLR